MLSVLPKAVSGGHIQLHASTVVIAGNAVSLIGPSGVGKSDCALGLMGLGAVLLADDVTWLASAPDALIASCPPTLSGQIEARGVGLLTVQSAPPTPLRLIVDMGVVEKKRLPEPKHIDLLGHEVRLLHKPETPHFIAAIWHYMRALTPKNFKGNHAD